jgi:hypothetical protein
MVGVFGALLLVIVTLCQFQVKKSVGNWLPLHDNLAKRQYEIYSLAYSAFWICVFGGVIVGKLYEHMDEVL